MSPLLPRVRTRLARLIWRFILGPIAGNMPGNYVFSINDRKHDPKISRHLVATNALNKSTAYCWDFPDEYPSWFHRDFVFPSEDVFLMRDVVVCPYSGGVWTPEGLVLGESIGSLNKALTFGKALPDLCCSPVTLTLPHDAAVQIHIPAPPVSYFHWMCEVLPNLIRLVSLYPQARLCTAPDKPRYVDESLRVVFGHEFCSQKIIESRRPLRVSQAAFVSMPTSSGFVRPDDASAVRKAVLDKLSKTEAATTGQKIFISRRGTKARAIPDQDSLEQQFVQDGYRIVQLETMPWVEQVRLFANAESVAGLHGAGFANILFAPSNCSVHEIFPEGYCNDCYARLAESLGMVYRYSLANGK
jgi:hypothetical protein